MTSRTALLREKYLRRLPTAFCPGCGNGQILRAFIEAIDDLGIDKNKIVAVSGIGCSAWISSPYLRVDTLHTTHGRAIAFATGVALTRPDLYVVVFTGDGDGAGIGGNHLIHAARRGVNMLVILVNNGIYAMTGGQSAPTTPTGLKTKTHPTGFPERPFDIANLVLSAGADYVARWTTYHLIQLKNSIKEALNMKGFRFIEVISQCPTHFGRAIGITDPWTMIQKFKEMAEKGEIKVGVFRK